MNVEQLTLFEVPLDEVKKQVCLEVGEFAKVLASKGIKVGQNRLFKKLKEWSLLDESNIPFQRYIDAGYYKVIKEQYSKRGDFPSVYLKVLITPSGQRHIEERYRNERNGNWS